MKISALGQSFDVRFQRIVDGKSFGFYSNGLPKIRSVCLISRITGKEGREGYEFLAGAGVMDTMRSNKNLARKRSFAKALLNMGLSKHERTEAWVRYFVEFPNG
mgnify:CR=1 FL=1